MADNKVDALTNVIVDTETAQRFRRLMMTMADPYARRHEDDISFLDMVFPGLSPSALHDIGTVCSASPGSIIMGRDPTAWEMLLRTRTPAESFLVGIWTKTNDSESPYRLSMVVDSRGRAIRAERKSLSSTDKTLSYGPPMEPYPEDLTPEDHYRLFLSYQDIRHRILANRIKELEMERYKDRAIGTITSSARHAPEWHRHAVFPDQTDRSMDMDCVSRWSEIMALRPHDDRHDGSTRIAGMVTRTVREMCNDEDSGFITQTWDEYMSYRLQTRWIYIRHR